MKKYFTILILLLTGVSLWAAESKLTVNLNGGEADEYLLEDIREVMIIDNTVSVQGVSIESNSKELKVDETYQIMFSITPDNATNKNVTWSSSDNNIATVDGNGLVTAIAEGTALISIETEDGKLTDEMNIVVSPVTSVEITDLGVKIYPNPIQNVLYIETGDIANYEIVITDVSGNILHSQFDNHQVDFSNFATGNYFLTLIANNKYYNFKLIKN
jgi:transglutaminase/protease-like cytokinesis protein 3